MAANCRIASRTGIMLIPSCSESSCSRMWLPAGMVPSQIASKRAVVAASAAVLGLTGLTIPASLHADLIKSYGILVLRHSEQPGGIGDQTSTAVRTGPVLSAIVPAVHASPAPPDIRE